MLFLKVNCLTSIDCPSNGHPLASEQSDKVFLLKKFLSHFDHNQRSSNNVKHQQICKLSHHHYLTHHHNSELTDYQIASNILNSICELEEKINCLLTREESNYLNLAYYHLPNQQKQQKQDQHLMNFNSPYYQIEHVQSVQIKSAISSSLPHFPSSFINVNLNQKQQDESEGQNTSDEINEIASLIINSVIKRFESATV